MGLFSNEQEKKRLASLKSLEDRRLAFAARLRDEGISFSRVLLAQVGGGFMGLGVADGRVYLLSGPAPGDELPFEFEDVSDCRVRFEPHVIVGEGMQGIMGLGGKRGGRGYLLTIERQGERRTVQIVPGHQAVFAQQGGALPLLSAERRKRDANFVWDFRAIQARDLDRLVGEWSALI